MLEFLFSSPFILILLIVPLFFLIKLTFYEGHRFSVVKDLFFPFFVFIIGWTFFIEPMNSQILNMSFYSEEGAKINVPDNHTVVERNETVPYYKIEPKNQTVPWNNEWVK
jgi:hypothetical protein